MTVVAQDLLERSMEYVPKQILTWGSDSTCLGEIRKFQKFLSAGLERCVYHFTQYEFNWISNIIFLSTFTIVIPRLPYLFRMAKAVSSIVELANSVTSDSVNSFNFAIWAFASKCFPIELVQCSDGLRRIWWQRIHMMPGLPVSSIPQCK